jgi:hypothetical protein
VAGVRERGGVQIFERFASGSPPSFVQVDKARRIRERDEAQPARVPPWSSWRRKEEERKEEDEI